MHFFMADVSELLSKARTDTGRRFYLAVLAAATATSQAAGLREAGHLAESRELMVDARRHRLNAELLLSAAVVAEGAR